MKLTERVAQLEAENEAMRAKLESVLERMDLLEDCLNARLSGQDDEPDSVVICLHGFAGDFADNKDVAAQLREDTVRPALRAGSQLAIDFAGVEMATQGFVHALVADVIRTQGPCVLDQIVFENCGPAVQAVVSLVVDYAQQSGDGPAD